MTSLGACEAISFGYFNREEIPREATGNDFSPRPIIDDSSALCWESTVLSMAVGFFAPLRDQLTVRTPGETPVRVRVGSVSSLQQMVASGATLACC